jgi:3-oxoacyl-[acyl-carrier protein] reductase
MEINNKVVVLVTGGGTAIGRATSLLLAKRGATVIVNYSRSQSDAEETVRWINNEGERAVAVQADVSQNEEVRIMFEAIVQQFGTVDNPCRQGSLNLSQHPKKPIIHLLVLVLHIFQL